MYIFNMTKETYRPTSITIGSLMNSPDLGQVMSAV